MSKNEIHKPDFFIVGAPKSGTTSLYYYLSQHKNIFLPPKELYCFGEDFTYINGKSTLKHYLSYFTDAKKNQKKGEASVWYLYSKNAAAEIKAFNPAAKIIIMLRQPTDMIYSLHQHQVFNGNEDITDFKAALQAQAERANGKKIPVNLGCPIEGLQYQKVGKYYDQVKRYLNVFGSENVHIIWFDDFKNDVKVEYKKVCTFLNIAPLKTIDLSIKNKSQKARSKKLTKILRHKPARLVSLVKIILPNRTLRHKVLNLFWKLNSVEIKRTNLSKTLEQRLNLFFTNDIEKLEKLTNKDLTNWKNR